VSILCTAHLLVSEIFIKLLLVLTLFLIFKHTSNKNDILDHLNLCYNLLRYIKPHGSESRGQERAKRSPKTKHTTNYCVLRKQTLSSFDVIITAISLKPHQLLNPHCRHKTFLPTLTNTPKIKAIG